jgi:hypothetical protein
MSQPNHDAPSEKLHDLTRPQEELSAEDAEQVRGGFNPQPDPPGYQFKIQQVTINPISSTSLNAEHIG